MEKCFDRAHPNVEFILGTISKVTITEQNFVAGLKLRITTPVKGNPIPTFSWTKDGKPLSGDRVHAFSDGELVNLINTLLVLLAFCIYKLCTAP